MQMIQLADQAPSPAIRPIQPDEIDHVVAILQEASQWLISRGIAQWNPADFDHATVTRWMSSGVVLAAWREHDAIGTVTIDEQDDGLWTGMPGAARYIHKLAISRHAAGQGVSRALLRAAEAHVAAQGYPSARLDCWAGNTALRRFYTNAGYTLRAIVTETTDEETWECALFEKSLSDFH
jgi:ribosomal protein S18 acetylase RimI-like enzyme